MDAPRVNSGIGGWLVLPAIGLVLMPVTLAFVFYRDVWPVFSEGYWSVLTTPGSEAYHPYWAPFISFEAGSTLAMIAAALVVMYFFFTKSRRAPRMMTALLAIIPVVAVVELLLADQIPVIGEQDKQALARELGRAIIAALVWIPYFQNSQRVKATFTS